MGNGESAAEVGFAFLQVRFRNPPQQFAPQPLQLCIGSLLAGRLRRRHRSVENREPFFGAAYDRESLGQQVEVERFEVPRTNGIPGHVRQNRLD